MLEYLLEQNEQMLERREVKLLKSYLSKKRIKSVIYFPTWIEDILLSSFETYCTEVGFSYLIYTNRAVFILKSGDFKFARGYQENENYIQGTFHEDLEKYVFYYEIAEKYKDTVDVLFGQRI